MFEKNLNDFVRGLRNNKNNESKFITECLDEIKQELRQENMNIKANAVLKLSYIQMLGYDITWAAFNIIEVMSSQKFTHKRIAYMTASQSFHSDLDVLMLATNLIKKDMNSGNQYDAGSSMAGLSCFISPDLARDLANDIMSMIVSSKPYIRKRSVLLMYKVFLKFPEALRPAFPRLKERLEDDDSGVQCAAVNVICELARKHPNNYLALAPLFFKLMTTSSNNWMLIKIIKLFGALCPLEPRLGKKLLEPLTSLIHSTSAMSLLYECINTVVAGLPDHAPSMQLCVSKLRLLIEDQDQNLKYLGLLLLNKILKSQPKLVLGHRDLIMRCLDDRDESIRYRALDLIVGMISKKTLHDIVRKLLEHMEKAEGSAYRDELLSKIIQICSQSNYQFITNFEWYIDILIQLSAIEGTKHGKLIASQMLDVVIRVKAIRGYAVPVFVGLLDRPSMYVGVNTACEVLFAAAFLAGEFVSHVEDTAFLIDNLVNPRVTSLPGHVQCVIIQAIAKLFSQVLQKSEQEGGEEEELSVLSEKLINTLPIFMQSSDLEVQDRSCCVMQLIKLVMKMKGEGVRCAEEVGALFAEELLPVAPKAQKKVPVPEGLDLDKWINEPLSESDGSDSEDAKPIFSNDDSSANTKTSPERYVEPDAGELKKAKEARLQYQESNPHYLKGETKKREEEVAVSDIPVKTLDAPIQLKVAGEKKGKKGKKGKKKSVEESNEEEEVAVYEIADNVDIEGDENKGTTTEDADPMDMLNVDLDAPLADHEVIPVAQHRVVKTAKPTNANVKKTRKKSDKESKKKIKTSTEEGAEEKKTKKKKKSQKEGAPEGGLLAGEQDSADAPPKKKSGKKKKQTEEERKATLLAQASTFTKEVKQEENTDDMDFWLATPKVKDEPTAIDESAAKVENTEDVEAVEKPKKKKTPKEKKKKKKGTPQNNDSPQNNDTPQNNTPQEEVDIMQLGEVQTDPWAHYDVLCEDKNIKLLYEVRTSHHNQVVASIIFKNLTSQHIKKLEFNVIDSLNMKLIRHDGENSREPVQVPFILLPEMTNEGQFAFNVESIVMSQWLRGTLTYITSSGDSSTSEKLDFKINFPVSVHIQPVNISSSDFTSLLADGELSQKQSIKVKLPSDASLEVIAQILCTKIRLTVVEMVEHGVSLYGMTTQSHPICLLVKTNSENVMVDGKSTDFQLLSSVITQIQHVVGI